MGLAPRHPLRYAPVLADRHVRGASRRLGLYRPPREGYPRMRVFQDLTKAMQTLARFWPDSAVGVSVLRLACRTQTLGVRRAIAIRG